MKTETRSLGFRVSTSLGNDEQGNAMWRNSPVYRTRAQADAALDAAEARGETANLIEIIIGRDNRRLEHPLASTALAW